MARVTVRELRNQGGKVLDRVTTGERITVTRSGKPVAELSRVSAAALTASALLERWHRLPDVDPAAFRLDIDSSLDPRL